MMRKLLALLISFALLASPAGAQTTVSSVQSQINQTPYTNGQNLLSGGMVQNIDQQLLNLIASVLTCNTGGCSIANVLPLTGGALTGPLTGPSFSSTNGIAGSTNLYTNPTQPPNGTWLAGANAFGTCPLTQAPCGYFAGDISYDVYSQQYIKATTALGATHQEFDWSLDNYINSGAAPQWKQSTGYAAGACVDTSLAGTSQAGNIYCTTSGGVSASSGLGPSGLTVPITDGTVIWTSAIGDFTNQKVGWFNSTLVGPLGSSRTWGNAEATIWQSGYTGILGLNFEMDAQDNGLNTANTGYFAENLRLGGAVGLYPLTCDLCLFHGTSAVTAGAFVVGQTYTILTVGTTSFTSIGATANTVGTTFVATGVGSGTGTAAAFATQNGILINSTYQSSAADIAVITLSPTVLSTAGTHNAVWNDNSTAQAAISLGGNYSVAAFLSNGFKVDPTGNVTENSLNLTAGTVSLGGTLKATFIASGFNLPAGQAFSIATSLGVTCSGTPTTSFTTLGGIVTHC